MFGHLQRNISHMICLEQIRVDPAAPEFARSHPKAEMIWAKQYVQLADVQLADLTNYPVEGQEVAAWKEGKELADELGGGEQQCG